MNEAQARHTIVNARGLHARAASKLVNVANRYQSHVQLQKDEQSVDAKSVMGVLLLCGVPGAQLTITARGPDAEAAVDAIGELIDQGFGEVR